MSPHRRLVRRLAPAAAAPAPPSRSPGVAATVVAVDVIVPHFHEGAVAVPRAATARSAARPAACSRTSSPTPGVVLGKAFDERGVRYLLALVLPLAGLSLPRPWRC